MWHSTCRNSRFRKKNSNPIDRPSYSVTSNKNHQNEQYQNPSEVTRPNKKKQCTNFTFKHPMKYVYNSLLVTEISLLPKKFLINDDIFETWHVWKVGEKVYLIFCSWRVDWEELFRFPLQHFTWSMCSRQCIKSTFFWLIQSLQSLNALDNLCIFYAQLFNKWIYSSPSAPSSRFMSGKIILSPKIIKIATTPVTSTT